MCRRTPAGGPMKSPIAATLGLVALLCLSGCGDSGTTPADDETGPVTGTSGSLRVLSNRPDLLSGDDVLIEVVLPTGVPPEGVVVTRNGSIASGDFGLDGNGRYLARVTGLAPGANQI